LQRSKKLVPESLDLSLPKPDGASLGSIVNAGELLTVECQDGIPVR